MTATPSPYTDIVWRYHKKLPVGDKVLLAESMDEIESGLKGFSQDFSIIIDVNIILDELITNIFMHGYAGKDVASETIAVSVIMTDSHIIIRIRDRGIAFDPNKHIPKLPQSNSIDDLDLGGLGVFMVRERVSQFDYVYRGGYNVQTLTKELPQKFYNNDYKNAARTINNANEKTLAKLMQGKQPQLLEWKDWEAITKDLTGKQKTKDYCEYRVPLTIDADLQKGAYKVGTDYQIEIEACSWGDPKNPPLICFGGILNTAHRFTLLSQALAKDYFVVGVSWAGRGMSDWLIEEGDYNLDVHAEHISAIIEYFQFKEVTILGSSLGGSAALKYLGSGKYKTQMKSVHIKGLILNDTGFLIPASRRARRSMKVGRHYIFPTPQDLLRRYELANRTEAYIPESFLLLYAHWQSKRFNDNAYSYNHDYRALSHYRFDASDDLNLQCEWDAIGDLPVLLLHGEVSTALTENIYQKMLDDKPNLRMVDVKWVGHTPPLTDEKTIGAIGAWLQNPHDENIQQRQEICPKKFTRSKIFVFNAPAKNNAVAVDVPLVQDFFVVRHGMTDFNQQKIRCGSEHDVPINYIGIAEAIRYGHFFKKHFAKTGEASHSRIYCGGLQRILKTAHIISEISGIPDLYNDSCFNERWLGEYSGTPHAKYEKNIKDNIPPKQGETEEAFFARSAKALDIIMHHVAVTPIVVTSRGIIIRMLRLLANDYKDLVENRDVIYNFKYDIAKSAWKVKKTDASKIKFNEAAYQHLFDQLAWKNVKLKKN